MALYLIGLEFQDSNLVIFPRYLIDINKRYLLLKFLTKGSVAHLTFNWIGNINLNKSYNFHIVWGGFKLNSIFKIVIFLTVSIHVSNELQLTNLTDIHIAEMFVVYLAFNWIGNIGHNKYLLTPHNR